jgi:uncharacterized membrane protein (DUF485 family)
MSRPANPFRRFILSLSLFVMLVVACDLVVLVAHIKTREVVTAALISAALAFAAMITLVVLVVTGRRFSERMQQILAGNYLVRWHYAQGEWRQFVTQERTRTIRASLLFLPLTLALVVLLILLSPVLSAPLLGSGIAFLLLIAGAFFFGLVQALVGRRAFRHRQLLSGDTYISQLGIIRPDGYRSLRTMGYHVVTASLVPGAPSRLHFVLQPRRVARLIGLLGYAPGQFEVVVPVPHGHEAEADAVAGQVRSMAYLW